MPDPVAADGTEKNRGAAGKPAAPAHALRLGSVATAPAFAVRRAPPFLRYAAEGKRVIGPSVTLS